MERPHESQEHLAAENDQAAQLALKSLARQIVESDEDPADWPTAARPRIKQALSEQLEIQYWGD